MRALVESATLVMFSVYIVICCDCSKWYSFWIVFDIEYPIGKSIFTNTVGISLSINSWNSVGIGIKFVGTSFMNANNQFRYSVFRYCSSMFRYCSMIVSGVIQKNFDHGFSSCVRCTFTNKSHCLRNGLGEVRHYLYDHWIENMLLY